MVAARRHLHTLKPVIRTALRLSLGVALISLAADATQAQIARGTPRPPQPRGVAPKAMPVRPQAPAPMAGQPMRKPNELINRQAPITVNRGIYDNLTPDSAREAG